MSSEKKRAPKSVNSLVINTSPLVNCIACGQEKHQLLYYVLYKFRSLSHTEKSELLRSRNYYLNCLHHGHYTNKCRSLNRCKHCQKCHNTLLHAETKGDLAPKQSVAASSTEATVTPTLHVSIGSNILLMTRQVMVETPQGVIKARALLDTGSSASFVSERLAQSLHLRRFTQNAKIFGIAGLPHSYGKQSVTQFDPHLFDAFPRDQIQRQCLHCATDNWRLTNMPNQSWTSIWKASH